MFGSKQVLLFVLLSFLFLAVTNGSDDEAVISGFGDECKTEKKCPPAGKMIFESFLFNFVTTPTNKFNFLLHAFALRGFKMDAEIADMAKKKGNNWKVFSIQVEMRPVSSMSAETLDYIVCVNDKIAEENKERKKTTPKGEPIKSLLIPYHHYANVVFRRTRTAKEIKDNPGKDTEEFRMGYIERNGQWELHGTEKSDPAGAPVVGLYVRDNSQVTLNSLIEGLTLLGDSKYDGADNNCQEGVRAVQDALATLQGLDGESFEENKQDMPSVVEAVNFVTDKCYPTITQTVCYLGKKAGTGIKEIVSNVVDFVKENPLLTGLVIAHVFGYFEQELGNLEEDIDKLIA